MAQLYKIVRFYQNERRPRVIARNLSLKDAQAWCNDPETSSHTAKSPRGCGTGRFQQRNIDRWNALKKHWFDGYERQ